MSKRRKWALALGVVVLAALLWGRNSAPPWPNGPVSEQTVGQALKGLEWWQAGRPHAVQVTQGSDGYRVIVTVRPPAVRASTLLSIAASSAAAMFGRLFQHPEVAFARLAVEQEFEDARGVRQWAVAVRLDAEREKVAGAQWGNIAERAVLEPEAAIRLLSGFYLHPALARELSGP